MVSLNPSLHNTELSNAKLMDYTVKCSNFEATPLFKRSSGNPDIESKCPIRTNQEIQFLFCVSGHTLHLLVVLPSGALVQCSYLYLTFEINRKYFSNPTTHQINSQKMPAVLEWLAWLLVSPHSGLLQVLRS